MQKSAAGPPPKPVEPNPSASAANKISIIPRAMHGLLNGRIAARSSTAVAPVDAGRGIDHAVALDDEREAAVDFVNIRGVFAFLESQISAGRARRDASSRTGNNSKTESSRRRMSCPYRIPVTEKSPKEAKLADALGFDPYDQSF